MKTTKLLVALTLTSFLTNMAMAQNERTGAKRFSNPTSEELYQDQDFQRGLEIIFAEMKPNARNYFYLPKDEKAQFNNELARYAKEIQTNPDAQKPRLVKKYFVQSEGFVMEMKSILSRLKRKFPKIENSAVVAEAAQEWSYSSNGIEYGFSDVDNNYCDEVDCACTAKCNEEYRQAANAAGYDWFFGAILDFPSTGFIWGWVKMTQKIHKLGEQRLDCLETCDGISFPNRCSSDSDCGPTQYCQHTFGNPYHQCIDRKSLGQTCSRHAKCASNCCKFHPASNPVSKVCRPANKCD